MFAIGVLNVEKIGKIESSSGGGQVNALEGTAETKILEPNAGNIWDSLQFLWTIKKGFKPFLVIDF